MISVLIAAALRRGRGAARYFARGMFVRVPVRVERSTRKWDLYRYRAVQRTSRRRSRPERPGIARRSQAPRKQSVRASSLELIVK